METRADQVRAFVYAIGLHLLIGVLMVVGLFWTRSSTPVSVAGPPIEATLVIDPNATVVPTERPRAPEPAPQPEPAPAPPPPPEPEPPAAPPPQPEPEPRPQEAEEPPQTAPQEQLPDPDVVEQERIDELAAERAEQQRIQEEKRRQEQAELERQAQQEAEERERRRRQQEEREKQLAEIRRLRAEAEAQRKKEEQRLAQLDRQARERATERADTPAPSASPPPGNNGTDSSLQAQYSLAIQEAILRHWRRPETVPLGTPCELRIIQIPGGEVINADVVGNCPFDAVGKRSIEAAVLNASPLPYAGFESVFNRQLNLKFTAQDR
ncbi:cell envelope integrity protein TolA [Coralloluteibacterium stylophorae]|uniref:Cell envelope integrity protein TolA n=1 Tax=Coralloluteibacterium stylophorae TaxID=1776034 RepID=A0A8J7VSX8_9GAMM|nr:cell envelope integrity protein TolA [Coralloluteibacterium stylophorae]MBS7456773.1 cell envelope integrity protein TolA [Coralloluteibacterium stylophorae]